MLKVLAIMSIMKQTKSGSNKPRRGTPNRAFQGGQDNEDKL